MGTNFYLGNGQAFHHPIFFTHMIIRSIQTITLLLAIGCASAQSECAQRYDDAKGLYDSGDRAACIAAINSAMNTCGHDREQAGRLLFLRSLALAGADSLERMRADLERLFRTDRRYVIKAYDPLMKGKPGEADLYGAWEILHAELGKDLGLFRAGIHIAPRFPMVKVSGDRKVFETDTRFDHTSINGWEAGAQVEYDVLKNVAVRLMASYQSSGYHARNNTIRYDETITTAPVFLGVKKMFWLGARSPWVPHLMAGATWSRLLSVSADIQRSGDGVRLLAPKTFDRLKERTADQFFFSGAVGASYKVGQMVLFAEGQYDAALTKLTLDSPTYTESELLTRYYYVDNEVTLSGVSVRAGIQYIVKYHKRNRIH